MKPDSTTPAGSRRDQIVSVARDLLEERGPDGVTMRAIAEQLGIRAPSLYKHISDKGELEAALAARALREQAVLFETVAPSAPDPLVAIAAGYRAWARANPHLYRLLNDRPLRRDLLPEGLEARATQPLLDALGGDRSQARAAWAFAHGMVALELADRFPADADIPAAWAAGLRGFTATPEAAILAAIRSSSETALDHRQIRGVAPS